MDEVLKIALGVFIGALAAAFTWEGIQAVRLEIAMEQAKMKMQEEIKISKARQAERDRAQYEEQQRNQREAEEARQRQIELAQIEIQRKRDKEDAFKKFWQPTPSCKADPVQNECANSYIKAQTIFNSQYVPIR